MLTLDYQRDLETTNSQYQAMYALPGENNIKHIERNLNTNISLSYTGNIRDRKM
jgi:hypothetical protein